MKSTRRSKCRDATSLHPETKSSPLFPSTEPESNGHAFHHNPRHSNTSNSRDKHVTRNPTRQISNNQEAASGTQVEMQREIDGER